MKRISTIGIDLAKNTFQLHGVDEHGDVVLRRTLRRSAFLKFFANLPSCLIGMEACATSAYWAREIEALGHEVRRIHPKFVVPYRMADKNDANDAAAICEAVSRPRMRFVPAKSQEQSDIQAVHRVRAGLVRDRTAKINTARGLLAENGIVFPKGANQARKSLADVIGDESVELSGLMRAMIRRLYEMITFLDAQIDELGRHLHDIAHRDERCKRLLRIPGIGTLGATMLLAVAGRPHDFKNGRQFSAFLGLTPRQHSTGGKQRLLGISKRGDAYTRTLLINGARAALQSQSRQQAKYGGQAADPWLMAMFQRRGHNKTVVALANKMARIAWSMLASGAEYGRAA